MRGCWCPSKVTSPEVGGNSPARMLQQGAFAAARRPQHADKFLRANGKGDRTQRVQAAIPIREDGAQVAHEKHRVSVGFGHFGGRKSFVKALVKSTAVVYSLHIQQDFLHIFPGRRV